MKPVRRAVSTPCLLWLATTVFATPAAMTAQQTDPLSEVLLQGVVYDVQTGDAIAGATVSFGSLQQPTSSDSAGVFSVRGIRPGGHIVTVTRFGYERRDLPINLTGDGNAFIEIGLTPSPILLDSLTVVAPDRVAVHGMVYDMVSGTAIPGAAVFVESENHGTLADSLGSFVAADVPPGPQLITVKQIGYHDKVIAFTATGRPEDVVTIPLMPKPFMMDGITAVARNVETMEDRMRSRRGDASVGRGLIRAYDREALLASGAATGLDFVDDHTIVRMMPCPAGELEFYCIGRGSYIGAPRVYIDEIWQPEGLTALQRLSTSELYSVEVYFSGSEVRGYTYEFMERTARKPQALIPVLLWRWGRRPPH
ncbi:MAG: carboxypeptidase-like regulatory domain-containing protein [Gammaproteobacteria bacterium]|nr:carboxypeptidase-like regulatory domain-containing protein [Gammaproteobacteria bacterium]MYF60497.1 carboxypeptidase-like regulatory domain-containing protein [Gammaproteobacteria bacterium]MYI22741.1 carboxypeptidase-like regulatory domain-containing protein [Gammaproteobacteria bacterium]